ncbi:MAG TPA: 50S ribosomal protein L9 [Pseudomonadales bacterium]|nr:50S ribosomal protein L9 [Pseudomonadales bacterium]
MNVILLERIRNLGDLGDEVDVKNGFGRNFLIPQGKAVRASKSARETFEARRAELEQAAKDRLSGAEGRAAQIEGKTLTIAARAEEGKLYGSVGPREVSEALAAEGLEVAVAEIKMPTGVIREIGEYQIDVLLHSDVATFVTVVVIPE